MCVCRFPAQPEWLQVMSDSEVEISSELQWSCAAAGKPRPTIRWLRNGQPLSTQVSHTDHTTHTPTTVPPPHHTLRLLSEAPRTSSCQKSD